MFSRVEDAVQDVVGGGWFGFSSCAAGNAARSAAVRVAGSLAVRLRPGGQGVDQSAELPVCRAGWFRVLRVNPAGLVGSGGCPPPWPMVRITYHGTPAVKGVRLELPAGQMRCVSGPSGSGKSTLLRRISLLEAWDAGTVEVDGVLVGYDRVAREADGTDACG
ncbi:ATP-binding cassette domain-containing protein [Streptomyces shenzhenensis]|uniref:ATP-binding cassette domain-containing protein n=1 Tax=Streptomyces shenzhenensis TaxID=943815 RepID=UPI00217F1D5F|nr:ATP-binding cassette domain-containing protein [Streptomyces shenzhenensis]